MTRSYYPPVIPFNQEGCTFFILSDGATGPAPNGSTAAGAGVDFETMNVESALEAMAANGGAIIDEAPTPTGIRFADPFGNIHELVRATPALHAPTPAEAKAVYERFKSLEGDWAGRSTKGWTDRVNYKTIAGGSVVMESSFEAHPNEMMTTMFHLDGERLLLTHYCVARNQPRLMLTAVSDDGTVCDFTFLDATNLASRDKGHMDRCMVRFISPESFSARWTWYQDGTESWMEEIIHERVKAGEGGPPADPPAHGHH
jgi:hypothetical protein